MTTALFPLRVNAPHEPSASNVESLPQVLWLDLPRTELYTRIDERVRQIQMQVNLRLFESFQLSVRDRSAVVGLQITTH